MFEIVYAAQETANEAASSGVIGTLGINLKLFIAQLVNFLIVVLVLWRFAYRPLLKILHERKRAVEEGIENAKAAAGERAMAAQAYQQKVDEAQKKANEIIASAQVEAEENCAAAHARAKEEVEQIIKEARVALAKEKEKMRAQVKEETAGLVFEVAEKVLEEKLDVKKETALIKRLLASSV